MSYVNKETVHPEQPAHLWSLNSIFRIYQHAVDSRYLNFMSNNHLCQSENLVSFFFYIEI